MHEFELLEILAIGFLLALAFGYLTFKLKLSPIVGYLLAGFIIGPFSPGFVADPVLAGQLAEVGVILLMFGVGLHFDLKDLWRVSKIAIPGAIFQSAGATVLGITVGYMFGLNLISGIILGFSLAVASTVVLIRVLEENNMIDMPEGHAAVGWLIVEDIFTVFILVLLPTIEVITGSGSNSQTNLPQAILVTTAKIVFLGILIVPVGGKIIPWLMSQVARTRSTELFTLTVLVLAFVIATGSALVFGASIALGAFLAGMVVGRTRVSHQAAADVLPLRDAFAVMFFLSVGMIFDPGFLFQEPGLVIAALLIILLAKPLIAGVLVVLMGYSVHMALTIAIGLAQIGEFSFILAQQALKLKLIPDEIYNVLVACALISISLNPLLFRCISPLENLLRRFPSLWHALSYRADKRADKLPKLNLDSEQASKPRAIVVGYGPVGQRITTILIENGVIPAIIDLNVDTVNSLISQGSLAFYGDASRKSILTRAGIGAAKYILITLPDQRNATAVTTAAMELNPRIKVLVRARYIGAKTVLEGLGVTSISYEEEEVASAMAESLLEEVKRG